MLNDGRAMGVIQGVRFGCWDRGVGLSFGVHITESTAFGWFMYPEQSIEFIEAYGVQDIHQLEGKPVWYTDDDDMVREVKPCVIIGTKGKE